ncbi:copper amine oxidase [Paracraurococcus lichenis]|uniref:Amine oxidase n=1 Tax=Paracraurococcus lichenis TaxID=3064888 RepID=A0ABT9E4K0_9PROT|nr:tyramine oxidase [Paracraurococcus sp. LOR1-02]MDO9711005.1 tyramine oxidase [Paracraurococcus sp. LOR1-02]
MTRGLARQGLATWLAAWLAIGGIAAAHPLDPLTGPEIEAAVAALRAAGAAEDATRFVAVDLVEPAKPVVLAGQAAPRRAHVILRRGMALAEAEVDLASGRVDGPREIADAQGPVLIEEWETAAKLTMADPDWQAAMKKRGYTRFETLFCAPLTVGWFETAEERGRRLLRVPCYETAGGRTTVHGRPIEGLFAIVDLGERRVLRVVDTGAVPVREGPDRVEEATFPDLRPAMKPVLQSAPQGGNVTISGHEVAWDHWRFHLRLDRRFGPVLSLARWAEGGRERLVLYQGYASEMFVPYMDASEAWYTRSYMDIGEYGFGALSSTLNAGTDCPAHAAFLPAVLPGDDGKPLEVPGVLCIFERNTGNPAWRHAEIVDQSYEGRPEVELVVRSIPTIGNYDYVVDWVFTPKGEIRIDVGATGMDAVRGVAARSMRDAAAAAEVTTGMLIAPGAVGVWHDHYISFRLDLDVDGPANSFLRERLAPRRAEAGTPRRSLWQPERIPMPVEGAVEPGHGPEIWRVVNPGVTTALGHNPGYEVILGHGATSLLDPEDTPQRRAAFTAAPLWITAHDPAEKHAAGAWPNQAHGGDGLPRFAARGRGIEDADLVVWATMGFHHLTRPEDWPVLPTKWHRIELKPYGFFTRNPAITLRREFR